MSVKKAVFPLTSKTNFRVAQLTHNNYFQLSIVFSLALATQLIGWQKPVQALERNNNESSPRFTNLKPSLNSPQRRQKTISLPRIINLLAFSLKSQSVDSYSSSEPWRSPKQTATFTAEITAPNLREAKQLVADSKLATKPSVQIHQVQKGDTINKIAQQYKVSVNELIKLNQLQNSNLIYVNQRIQIPPVLGQGGASATDADVVAVANLESTSQSEISDINRLEEDPYITQLRAEIDQLQAEYRMKSEIDSDSTEIVSLATPDADPLETDTVASLDSNDEQDGSIVTRQENAIAALSLPSLADNQYLPKAFDGYIWPAQGVLTSHYGWRWGRIHQGIDIAAPIGTPIVAAAAGKVIGVGWYGGYGNLIKLEHPDGSVTYYAHNHRNLVTLGQKVEQGEQIAEMGNTGNSTGPHLHFEIRLSNKEVIDPLVLLGKR
ncbi:MAG: peptidoglycan DD-metalloendopeptidase family protein [Cyanobacteria bacterium J06643_13]